MQIRLVSYAAIGLLLCYFASACGQSIKPKPTPTSGGEDDQDNENNQESRPISSKKLSNGRAINFGHESKFGVVGSNARNAPIPQIANLRLQQQSGQPEIATKTSISSTPSNAQPHQQQLVQSQIQLQQQQQQQQQQEARQQLPLKGQNQQQEPSSLVSQFQQQVNLPNNFFSANVKPSSLGGGFTPSAGVAQNGNLRFDLKGSTQNAKVPFSSRSAQIIAPIKPKTSTVEEIVHTEDDEPVPEESQKLPLNTAEEEKPAEGKTTNGDTLIDTEAEEISAPWNSPSEGDIASSASSEIKQRQSAPNTGIGGLPNFDPFSGLIPNFGQFSLASMPQWPLLGGLPFFGGNSNPFQGIMTGQANNGPPNLIDLSSKRAQNVETKQSSPKPGTSKKSGDKTSSRSQDPLLGLKKLTDHVVTATDPTSKEVTVSKDVETNMSGPSKSISVDKRIDISLGSGSEHHTSCSGIITQIALNIDGLTGQLNSLSKLVPSLTTLPPAKLNSLIQLLYSIISLLKQITLAINKSSYVSLGKLINSLLTQLQVLQTIPQLGALLQPILELLDGLLPLVGEYQQPCITYKSSLSSTARGLGASYRAIPQLVQGAVGAYGSNQAVGSGANCGASGAGSYPVASRPVYPPSNYAPLNYPPSNYRPSNYPPSNYPPVTVPPKCKSSLVQVGLTLKKVLKLLFHLLKSFSGKTGLNPELLFNVKQLVEILKLVIGQKLLGIQLLNLNFVLGLIGTLGDKLGHLLTIPLVGSLLPDLLNLVHSLSPILDGLPELCIDLSLSNTNQ